MRLGNRGEIYEDGSPEQIRRQLEDQFFISKDKEKTTEGSLLWRSLIDDFNYNDDICKRYKL